MVTTTEPTKAVLNAEGNGQASFVSEMIKIYSTAFPQFVKTQTFLPAPAVTGAVPSLNREFLADVIQLIVNEENRGREDLSTSLVSRAKEIRSSLYTFTLTIPTGKSQAADYMTYKELNPTFTGLNQEGFQAADPTKSGAATRTFKAAVNTGDLRSAGSRAGSSLLFGITFAGAVAVFGAA